MHISRDIKKKVAMSARKYRKTLLSTKGSYSKSSQKRGRKRKTQSMASKEIAMDIAEAENVFVGPTPWQDAAFSSYIPKSTKVNLRYAGALQLSNGVSVFGHHIYGANDAYDPNHTGAGHQPRGFDQMMSMYEHYQVIGSKIRVFGEAGVEFCLVVGLRNDALPVSNIINVLESNPQYTTIAHSEGRVCQAAITFSQKDFFGQGQLDPDFQGTASSAPGQKAYFHIGIAANNPVTETTMFGYVVIDYICVFTEPTQPPQS